MRKLRYFTAVIAVLVGVLTLTACGSDDSAASSSPQDTKTIDVKFEGGKVTPNGERVDVAVGQPVEFLVTADAPGEIHVHSDPEQQLEYEKGTTILKLDGFKTAGIIEVESHALEKTIVQLEVR
jgi:hypothetical protein